MKRLEVPIEHRWDVEALYSSTEEWNKDFNSCKAGEPWIKLKGFQGRLKEGASVVLQVLETFFDLERHVSKLYVYASLRQDEDMRNAENKEMFMSAVALEHHFRQETAWISPEFLQLSTQELQVLVKDPILEPYKFYLEKIVRLQPHMLDADQEKLLLLQHKLWMPQKEFTVFLIMPILNFPKSWMAVESFMI